MKKYICLLIALTIAGACSQEEDANAPGNPVIEPKTEFSDAHFGDSIAFTIGVKDNDVPLSTLKAKLYFGDELVAETTIRTKNSGDYTGKLYVPYYANIPNGTATMEFVLTNTHLTTVKKTYDLPVTRPDYPYLILVTSDAQYPMERTGLYTYAATELFPSTDLPAYIKTPIIGNEGNEITFGWESGDITQGSTTEVPFVSPVAGRFSVTFNTLTYEAAPFFEIMVNEQKMSMVDKQNFKIDLNLTQGQSLTIEGIDNIAEWWIDADFFTKVSNNEFTFAPIAGKYRITANTTFKYFRVEAMLGNDLATLQADGTGAIWIIGAAIGKPSVAANETGWNTDKGLCMAPIGNKQYRITLKTGETVNEASINFKFFHQRDWGGEFSNTTLTTSSSIVFVGDGTTPDYQGNNRDGGNLGLLQALDADATYVFVVDVSAGNAAAVLTVTKQ
ncbi:MAG: DUF5125 domain-containing protein [Prevotellaceae bacterium]|jgi:hypothetical protein|nr:DUF5125 domain-containing protein [Prevotellaceae bacterium]